MKLPELYIQELWIILESLKKVHDQICDDMITSGKRAKRRALFMPWRARRIAAAFVFQAAIGKDVCKNLRDLHEKLLESTGLDEDMHEVTFREMIERDAAREKKNG